MRKQKYELDHDAFKSIDSEEKAYWLGFLAADGCVSSNCNLIGLQLQARDRDHIKKFKNFLKYTGPIEDRIGKNSLGEYKYKKSGIRFTSRYMVEHLALYGIVPKKSLILTHRPNIDKEFLRFYYRGYIDGDGSIGIQNNITRGRNGKGYRTKVAIFQLRGTQKFLDEFALWVEDEIDLHITPSYNTKNGPIYLLTKGGNPSVRKLVDFIYKDAKIYLNRKYDIVREICD